MSAKKNLAKKTRAKKGLVPDADQPKLDPFIVRSVVQKQRYENEPEDKPENVPAVMVEDGVDERVSKWKSEGRELVELIKQSKNEKEKAELGNELRDLLSNMKDAVKDVAAVEHIAAVEDKDEDENNTVEEENLHGDKDKDEDKKHQPVPHGHPLITNYNGRKRTLQGNDKINRHNVNGDNVSPYQADVDMQLFPLRNGKVRSRA